ncbi:MAG: DUF1553 domain-containing protein [Aureliella sp.]
MQKHRWLLQPLLTICVIIAGVSVVAGTLRRKPAIENITKSPKVYREIAPTTERVNEATRKLAVARGLSIAARADNLVIARRLSLALVGSGLSLEELRAFSAVPEDQQIAWWTDYLLSDPRWADYFAERFARAFVGTNDGPFLLFRRRKFNAWLSEQFREGRRYDAIAADMLSAEGLWTDTPQVNFITATMDGVEENRCDPILLAGRVSRAMLAQRIDCLQCHDDFLGTVELGNPDSPTPGMQEHFHSLAAFFSGTSLPDAVLQGIREDGREYKAELLGDTEPRVITPNVPFDNPPLPVEGRPRERLAAWVTHPDNLAFSRATVNRVWALMFSRPLVEPVDNIPAFAPVPEALDILAKDFSGQGFDLRRLIRTIALSDPFQRSSRAEFQIIPEHEDAWAVFPITQLRPEQISGSILQACKLTAINESSSIITRLQAFGESRDFLRRFGDRGEDEFDSDAVTISQRLLLMNGNTIAERTKDDLVNNASSRISALVGDDEKAVESAFLATLNRSPSSEELACYVEYLAGKKNKSRSAAMGDIYWAILNSTEFSWNH